MDSKTYVYFIRSKEATKIGVATDLKQRLAVLSTGNPNKLTVHKYIECNSRSEAFAMEKALHKKFASINILNEWFSSSGIDYEKIEQEHSVTCKDYLTNRYYLDINGYMCPYDNCTIDFIREVAFASKAAQFLLLSIKDGIGYGNDYHHVVKVQGTTKHEKNMISAGYKELVARDLVRRVKRGHYMINPNALIPIDYEQALKDWEDTNPLSKDVV